LQGFPNLRPESPSFSKAFVVGIGENQGFAGGKRKFSFFANFLRRRRGEATGFFCPDGRLFKKTDYHDF
jgi:hypothetical protein